MALSDGKEMQQIFLKETVQIQETIKVTGEDARHLAAVLRMRPGEKIRLSTADGGNYLGEIVEAEKDGVEIFVLQETPSTELREKIVLFQALPKGDRMETVIEKTVELGVHEIVPVEMERCVVRLDDKKKENRRRRYQAVAEAAAKQSKRSVIPAIRPFMSYEDAVAYARTLDVVLVPYECKRGMEQTREAVERIRQPEVERIGILIGPEGGFSGREIEAVQDLHVISLGERILRTDTAAITAVSLVMLACETKEGNRSK